MSEGNARPESVPQVFHKVVAHLKDGSYCHFGGHSDISAEDLLEDELWDEFDEDGYAAQDVDKIEFASHDMPKLFYHVATTSWSLGEVYSAEPQKSSADVLLEQLIRIRESKE